jgi:hypothetical protein
LLLQSKVSFAKGNYHESYAYVMQALELAQKKDMKLDVKRLAELKQAIIEKDPRVEDQGKTKWRAGAVTGPSELSPRQ